LTAGRVAELKARESGAHDRWQEEAVRREGVTAALDALEAKINDQKLVLLECERELSFAQSALRDREEARGQAATESARLRERLAEVGVRLEESEGRLAEMRASRDRSHEGMEATEAALA